MFRPPSELGRDTLSQAHSDKGPPAWLDRHSRIQALKAEVAGRKSEGGQDLKAKLNFGIDRQKRRRVHAINHFIGKKLF